MKLIPGKDFSNAKWSLCRIDPVDSNDSSFNNIISYLWWLDNNYLLIVVNFSPNLSKAHIRIDPLDYGSDKWEFKDLLNKNEFQFKGKDLDEYGLYIELEAWKGHVFNIQKII